MAQLETWYKQDLKKPLVVHRHADVFNQDSRGNLIGVEVYRDGEPVTLSGSIDGYCLLSDGTTVPAVGANRTGNKASILIPQTAYNVPGPITITIKNTDGNDITTLCAVVGLVRQSVSGNLVQPGDIVTDWSQSINSQLQAVQDAADNVGAIVAAPFAENTAYVVGNYVTYDGNLYRITADHAAGVTWANTAKTQCTVGTELYDLKSAINKSAGTVLIDFIQGYYVKTNKAVGSTINFETDIISSTAGYKYAIVDCAPGDVFTLYGKGGSNGRLWCFIDVNNVVKNVASASAVADNLVITAPADSAKLIINSYVETACFIGRTINSLYPDMTYFKTISASDENNKLSNISDGCIFSISNNSTWEDRPTGAVSGIFANYRYNSTYRFQQFIEYPAMRMYYRVTNPKDGSVLKDWTQYVREIDLTTSIGNAIEPLLGFITPTPSEYNNLVAKIGSQCFFRATASAGWTDLPETDFAGLIVNYKYAGYGAVQIAVSYKSGKPTTVYVRYVDPSTGTALGVDWTSLKNGENDIVYYALGDSITAGSYSNDAGEGIVARDADWSYPHRIGRKIGCVVHNLGVPGAAITEFATQVSNVGSDATIVTITGGANDYYGETKPLGTVDSATDYTTVCGALKSVIETVANTAPNARIVLISPFIIKYGSLSTKWSMNYASRAGFTYAQLSDAMKDIAEYYNIEFIDGTRSGPTNILNIGNVQKDNVHPTKEYYKTIANWVESKLF